MGGAAGGGRDGAETATGAAEAATATAPEEDAARTLCCVPRWSVCAVGLAAFDFFFFFADLASDAAEAAAEDAEAVAAASACVVGSPASAEETSEEMK